MEGAKEEAGKEARRSSAEAKSSYFPAGLTGLSPWASRSATPKGSDAGGEKPDATKPKALDHVLTHRHRLSLRAYPADCPPLLVRWFYAVDVAKRKPRPDNQPEKNTKPPSPPKKFVAFSVKDSRAIEAGFQKLVVEEDATFDRAPSAESQTAEASKKSSQDENIEGKGTGSKSSNKDEHLKIPVNEDYLFDVDIQDRELAPAYWLGPVYEVRRGTWFYQEGSTLRPCDENLATQLEDGFLKIKPFRYTNHARSSSLPRPTPAAGSETAKLAKEGEQSDTKRAADDLDVPDQDSRSRAIRAPDPTTPAATVPSQEQPQTHRLFGAHMNSVVTYQDAKTAWILTDDFLSRMGSTVYQRFVGGGYLGGTKVVRGYTEDAKTKDTKTEAQKKPSDDAPAANADGKSSEKSPAKEKVEDGKHSTPASSKDPQPAPEKDPPSKTRIRALERQMTDLVSSVAPHDPEQQEEEARKRDEQEIRDDYRDDEGADQGREIEHLILVTHGIGQRLGLRMESVNFVHDVNVLRKTLKEVYGASPDLQALNAEVDRPTKNSRVQVLPVCWRHLLNFPKESVRQSRKERDLSEMTSSDDEESYPSLDDITVEGVPAVRNLITDLALDVLLYQSAYREHISRIVQRECNRIYRLFMSRNPGFKGQISLMGHSLGSAILFDILCRQSDRSGPSKPDTSHRRPSKYRMDSYAPTGQGGSTVDLEFDVDSFFCVGSPIGLFQMLKGRTIAARRHAKPSLTGVDEDTVQERAPLGGAMTNTQAEDWDTQALPHSVASPKCSQLYNIFHPTDPISYRIEPLIASAMSSLKPQPLPYTKKGIFGAPVAQGLSGIGARVGQSVSGLWTSLSSGIASSILNRSLGISGEDLNRGITTSANTGTPIAAPAAETLLSVGAGTNIIGGNVISASPSPTTTEHKDFAEDKKRKLGSEVPQAASAGEHPPTLMDADIQTLYAGFQKRRKSHQSDESRDLGESPEWTALEERARKLRDEEAKVRALNSNGRVDYSIQEGVFDISLIASIASHLSYWGDEDVSHFMISQLLARHRILESGQEIRERWSDVRMKQI
ncbi:MAG: hypothetical protein M1823_002444 [Watsoniomyces obsoletus]|nr:MAG: hypothetical protein M1823_002444 [Watsoniomyces obsoletus]